MKKFLLLLSTIALTAGLATAASPLRMARDFNGASTIGNGLQLSPINLTAPAKADEAGFNIKFCGDLGSWFYIVQKNKMTYRCYIYVPAELATQAAGNKITEITFSAALLFSGTRQGSVFVAEDITGDPVTSTDCEVFNGYNTNNGSVKVQTVALEQPYEIKANVGFYIGYVVKQCLYSSSLGQDYPVGVDYAQPNQFAGTVDVTDNQGRPIATADMATSIGTNLYIWAKTVGNAPGFENLFSIDDASFGDFTLPVVKANDAELTLPIYNMGTNDITSVEYTLNVNGVESAPQTANVKIKGGQKSTLKIKVDGMRGGHNEVEITVTKVNNTEYSYTKSSQCIALEGEGYERKFVIEENTGTWCPNCPWGIMGLDFMTNNYGDKVVPIAVHYGDDMYTQSYYPYLVAYQVSSFPSSIVNRDPLYQPYPNSNYLNDAYKIWESVAAPARIDLDVKALDGEIEVTSHTTFDYSESNANYKLAFVILEDDVPGLQKNNLSSGWWGEQGSPVEWDFAHVARDIFEALGIDNSVPTTVTQGVACNYTTKLSTDNVENLNKTHVVALLLDGATGVILNASEVNSDDFEGVSEINTDNYSGQTEYYSLQGIKLSQPTPGTPVICRQGSRTHKMIVK